MDMSSPSNASDESLAAYVLGEAGPDLRADVERLASVSPEVAARLKHLQSTVSGLRQAAAMSDAFSLSPAQLTRLRGLGPRRAAEVRAGESMFAEAIEQVARLVFDSWQRPAMAGFRGVASERLLRFEFPGGSVDIRIAADPESIGRFWITGDATGIVPGRILTRSNGSGEQPETGSAEISGDGYFEFTVPPGEHVLEIHSTAGRVRIGPFDVERR